MKITKIILIGMVVIAFSNAKATAQGFGIRAGVNFSTLTGGDLPKVGFNTGYYAGIYYQMSLIEDFLYLQPELQYSAQGFSSNSIDYKMDYITIPILAKIYVIKIFSFEAGPQFGFNVNDNFNSTDFNGDSAESFDPAIALGFNINLPFRLSLDFRYVYGFSEVISGTDETNSVIQAGVGFRF